MSDPQTKDIAVLVEQRSDRQKPPEETAAEAILKRAGGKPMSPEEFDKHFGHLPTDGEWQVAAQPSGPTSPVDVDERDLTKGLDICIALECEQNEVLVTTDASFDLICPALGLSHIRVQ